MPDAHWKISNKFTDRRSHIIQSLNSVLQFLCISIYLDCTETLHL